MLRDELNKRGVITLPRPNRPSRPIANSHVYGILKNRYYVGVVTYEGVEYAGNHPALVSEHLFSEVQGIRTSRHQSGEKPRVHSHYVKGSVDCAECGEPLSFERSRNRVGTAYNYFYCLGRQRLKNGCGFRAIQAEHLEDLVVSHWSTITLRPRHIEQIRGIVLNHMHKVLPASVASQQSAAERLRTLERDSQKVLEAYYADAIDTHELKREQARIATTRAAAQGELNKLDVSEQLITRHLDNCLRLLSSAQQHYSRADATSRRELNQSMFEHLYVHDDEIVASDLKPAFRRLMSDSLRSDLESERKREQTTHVRTSDLWLVPEVGEKLNRDDQETSRDLPPQVRRTAPQARSGRFLCLERPRGHLPWEMKEPRAVKDRGSNELLLVGAVERYSRRSDLLRRLEEVRKQPQIMRIEHLDEPTYTPYRLQQRLDDGTRAQLVRNYQDGIPTTELTKIYRLSKASVLALLRDAGISMRRQGLDQEQTAEAIRLYHLGLSLVRVGEQVGFGPTSVANALRAAGLRLRDRHDWRKSANP